MECKTEKTSKITKFLKNEESIARYIILFCVLFMVFLILTILLVVVESNYDEGEQSDDEIDDVYPMTEQHYESRKRRFLANLTELKKERHLGKSKIVKHRVVRCSTCNKDCTFDETDNFIICLNMSAEDFNNYLHKKSAHQNLRICLRDINFVGNRLDQLWYNNTLALRSIKISLSNIEHIDPTAFCDPSMKNLEQLELLDIRVSMLHYHVFKDLHKLRELSISNFGKKLEANGFLQTLALTLQKFVYEGTKDADILDPRLFLTLSEPTELQFGRLTHLEFRKNNFKNILNKDTFVPTPNVVSLILANNQITSIQSETFVPMQGSLKYLDLSDNMITILPENFLSYYLHLHIPFQVDLSANFLSCECSLRKFSNAYRQLKDTHFSNKIYCATPIEFAGHLLDAKNVCLHNRSGEDEQVEPEIWIGIGIITGVAIGLSFTLCCIKWKPKVLNRTLLRQSKHQIIASKKKYSNASTQSFPLFRDNSNEEEHMLNKSVLSLVSENYILPNLYEAVRYNTFHNRTPLRTDRSPDVSPPPLPKRCSDMDIALKFDEVKCDNDMYMPQAESKI